MGAPLHSGYEPQSSPPESGRNGTAKWPEKPTPTHQDRRRLPTGFAGILRQRSLQRFGSRPLPPPPPRPPLTSQGERQRQTGAREGGCTLGSGLLEEVFLAVDAPGPGEAPVCQRHLTVCALEARAVPVSVQDLQDELVQDMLVAAGTLRDLCGGRGEKGRVSLPHGAANWARPCVDAFLFSTIHFPLEGKDRTQTLRAAMDNCTGCTPHKGHWPMGQVGTEIQSVLRFPLGGGTVREKE